MKKKGQAGTVILSGVIAVIVGVAMIPVFTSLIDDAQDIQTGYWEQFTNTAFNASTTLDHDDLVIDSIAVINATGLSTTHTNDTLRENSEFTIVEHSGVLTIVNRTGTWNVSYDYEPTTYIDSAVGRTVVRQVTLMYAVALILITLAAVGVGMYNRR